MFQPKRKPKSLSYSSVSLFESNPEEFFLRYLAGNRPARLPQENYMAVGSGFDAYIKCDLHAALFGPGSDPEFEFDALFVEQVEEHNRDFAREAGKVCFDAYKYAGAYDDLLAMLQKSIEPPKFESKVEGLIDGVPFLGKPDLRWVMQFPGFDPLRIVLDWKCMGYCSKANTSPSKGYALCRDGFDFKVHKQNVTKAAPEGKPSKSHNTEHNQYLARDHRGMKINAAYMEACNDNYADQVSAYGWLLGEKIGDENVVVWIDELAAKHMGIGVPPILRIATHKARVSRDYQLKLRDRIKACWTAVETGHVFTDMTREENDGRCEILDGMATSLRTDGSAEEDFFNECTRQQSFR